MTKEKAPKRVILEGPYLKNGYQFVKVLETKTNRKYRMPFHRYVWEECTGEKIPFRYEIHHKDGNKLNNNISNLEMLSRAAHRKLHKEYKSKKRLRKKIIKVNREIARRNGFRK